MVVADNDNAPAIVGNSGAANDNHNGGAQPLRFLSVCSGIEAASCAWPQWQAVAFSEIEKFPSAVLAHHYPDVPNLGDFTKIDTTKLGRVDILCGGTPCQAFSVAGLRRSLDDARGNLSLAFVELAHELAGIGSPNGRATSGNGLRNAVWENVVGVLSTKDNAFGCFLGGLVGADGPIVPPGRWTNAGMVSGPKGRAAWRVLDAQYFGVAQRRRRVIVVADFGNGADPAAVLFEPEGVRRHSPPSRETGEGVAADVAPSLVSSGRGVERTGDTRGQDPVVAVHVAEISGTINSAGGHAVPGNSVQDATAGQLIAYTPEIARCDATREGSSQDYESTTMVAVGVTGEIAHTLKAEGADASEDGTGRGTPIIAFTSINDGGDAKENMIPTLHVGSGKKMGGGQQMAVTVALRGREGGATAELGGEVATALRASSGGGDKSHVLTPTVYSIMPQNSGKDYKARPVEVAQPVMAGGPVGGNQGGDYVLQSAVRRLTPVECERLQGFADGYTAIPWRGKPASECPDGPRYKALGNSWAVPLFMWLGRRIDRLMPPLAANDNTNKDTARAA